MLRGDANSHLAERVRLGPRPVDSLMLFQASMPSHHTRSQVKCTQCPAVYIAERTRDGGSVC
jgi:hypothetical protein